MAVPGRQVRRDVAAGGLHLLKVWGLRRTAPARSPINLVLGITCAPAPFCRTSKEFVAGHVQGAAANVPFKLPAGNGTLVPNPDFVAQARGCFAAMRGVACVCNCCGCLL